MPNASPATIPPGEKLAAGCATKTTPTMLTAVSATSRAVHGVLPRSEAKPPVQIGIVNIITLATGSPQCAIEKNAKCGNNPPRTA
eukprot:1360279-Prymnesium_polylepis.4